MSRRADNLHTGLVIVVESFGEYSGDDVFINNVKIGHRPYDGADSQDAANEAVTALAEMLRERLGWPKKEPTEDDPW